MLFVKWLTWMEKTMKKVFAAAVLALAPMASFADVGVQQLSDQELAVVTGQAGISITPDQVILGLQQTSSLLNKLSPILPSKVKPVVTIVNSASAMAPVVNNLVNNGAKPTTQDIETLVVNGVAAGVAIGNLASGL